MSAHLTVQYDGRRSVPRCRQPAGLIIVETVVGCVILASLLLVVSQTLVLLNRQTRLADRAFVAQPKLENLMEEFTGRPWEEITTSAIEQFPLSETARSKLPHATLSGEVVEDSEPTTAKRISLRLQWHDSAGIALKPTILTGWVYKQSGEEP